jgi:hypothetical protein
VHIELTSTLTHDDENRLAPAVLKALSGVLDMLPIAYMIRVETTDQQVLTHVSTRMPGWEQMDALTSDVARQVIES